MEAGALVRVVSGRSSRLVGCTGTVVSFGRQIEVRLDGSDTVCKVNRNELALLSNGSGPQDATGGNKVAGQGIMEEGSIDPDRLEALVNEEDAAIVASLRRRTGPDGRTPTGRTPPPSPSSIASRQFDLEKELTKELAKQDKEAEEAEGAASGSHGSPKPSAAKDLSLVLEESQAAPRGEYYEDEGEADDWKDAEVEHAKNVELVVQWVQARRDRDYGAADRLRSGLRAKGIEPESLEQEAKAELAAQDEEEEGATEEEYYEDDDDSHAANLDLAAQWLSAKRAKDYATADAIRGTLRERGVEPEAMARQLRGGARGGVERGGGRPTVPAPRGARGAPRGVAQPRGGAAAAAAAAVEVDEADEAEAEYLAAEAHDAHVALAAEWLAAKRDKDYTTADRIRRQLRAQGVEPEDLAQEAEWKAGDVLRAQYTGLALRWQQAKRDKDYDTADRIRAELRAKGLEPEELVFAAEDGAYGDGGGGVSGGGEGGGGGGGGGASADPLGSKPASKPSQASSSLGQLLVIDYNVVEELPDELKATYNVVSQKWAGTADVLYTVKADQEQKFRARHAANGEFDLKQTRGGDFPALPSSAAPQMPKLNQGASWGSHLARKPPAASASPQQNGGGDSGALATEREAGARAAAAKPMTEEARQRTQAEAAAKAKAMRHGMDKRAAEEHEANLKLVAKWMQARRERDYITADEIRKQLRAKRVEPDELVLELQQASA